MYNQVGQIHCIQYIILVWYPNVCSWYCLSRQTVPHYVYRYLNVA